MTIPQSTTIQAYQLRHGGAPARLAILRRMVADMVEENGTTLRGEIMDQMPEELDPAAVSAARTLRMDMESKNGKTVAQLLSEIECNGNGDRPETMEYFGHYSAMQAMGHGVGLHDAFGSDVYESIKVPYVEFGSYSLSKDYTA